MKDGNGNPPVFSRILAYTDFPQAPTTESNPEGVWDFYLELNVVGDKEATMRMVHSER